MTNTVVIARKHFGIPHALFTGMNNVNYVRLYVPKGSTLISASGFAPPSDLLFKKPNSGWMTDADVAFSEDSISKDPASNTDMYEENGRTVFGNWTQTKPGTTTKTLFSYRLPWKISPLKKPSCVFYPTCSEYTKQAVEKYGALKGARLGFLRILRCHPWQKNRIDPLK